MKFEETFDFDHDVATVMRMFCDKEHYLKKYARLGGREPKVVDCSRDDARFTITVRHALEADQLSFPDFVKKRMGDSLLLRQTDIWKIPSRSGRIDVDIQRTPVEIGIDLRLHDRAGGARLELAFDINAGIPLIGGRIENAIAGPMTQRMRRDLEVSREIAADYAAPA